MVENCGNMEEDLVVRQATFADYDDVIKMSADAEAFDGADYLPAIYYQLLHDPDVHPFVTTKNGKVINFKYYYMYEGGFTAVAGGARTHIDYQHKGLNRKTGSKVRAIMKQKFPQLNIIVGGQLYRKDFHDNPSPNVVWSHRLRCLCYRLNPIRLIEATKQEYLSITSPQIYKKVEQLNTNEAVSLLTDKSHWPVFFKLPYFEAFTNWLPMPVSDRYLRLTALRNTVFATPDENPGGYKSISYGEIASVPKGYKYNFYYYGEDENDLTAHVLRHVHHLTSVVPPGVDLFFVMKYYEHFADTKFRQCIQVVLGPEFRSHYWCSDLCCTAKEIITFK